VAVDVVRSGASPGGIIQAQARVFSRAGLFSPPKQLVWNNFTPLAEATPQNPVHIFAAHADPVDEAHFSFVLKSGETARTFDGWIEEYDDVKIQERLSAIPLSPPSAALPQ
jgi:hypothetical protein